jgi:hypothetical protein
MTITTDKGIKIKISGKAAPEWSEFHKRFYVYGYRWIATKQKFSSNSLLHNFTNYTPNTVDDMLAGCRG